MTPAEATLVEMDALWEEAKALAKPADPRPQTGGAP